MVPSGEMRRALCVGIDQYPGTGRDLAGCVNDAAAWRDRLRNLGYDVTTLTNSEATRAGLLQALHALVEGAVAGATLVVSWSGHGSSFPAPTPSGRREVLCPYDVATGAVIADVEFDAALAARGWGVNAVSVLDTCHSGGMDRDLDLAAGPPWWHVRPVSRPRFMPPEVFLPALLPDISRARDDPVQPGAAGLLLAACQADQTAADTNFSGVARGAFSFYATQSLDAGREAQGGLTYDAWFAAIRSALPSDQFPQRPVLTGSWWQRSGRVFGG